jgi:hypothetical protein
MAVVVPPERWIIIVKEIVFSQLHFHVGPRINIVTSQVLVKNSIHAVELALELVTICPGRVLADAGDYKH